MAEKLSVQEIMKSRLTIDDIVKKTKKFDSSEKSYGDDNIFEITKDKNKNAYVVMRFLPSGFKDIPPYVLEYKHFYQGKSGKW